ncbi:MAG: transposase, partial [Bacteroidota bacterium]
MSTNFCKIGDIKKQEKKLSEGEFDFESYQSSVVQGLMEGKGLLGESGLLKPLIARFVEKALDAELTHHLQEESTNEHALPNKRNGNRSKKIRTESGEI